jgi:hypothetical protein
MYLTQSMTCGCCDVYMPKGTEFRHCENENCREVICMDCLKTCECGAVVCGNCWNDEYECCVDCAAEKEKENVNGEM